MFEQEHLRSRRVPESIENSTQTEKLSNRDVGVQSDDKVAEMREMSCRTENSNVSDKSDHGNMARKTGGITIKRSARSELVSSPIPPLLESFGCDGNGLMDLDQLTGAGNKTSSEARRVPESEMNPNLSDNDCVITRVVEKNSRSTLANEVCLPVHFFEEQQKMFKESQSLVKKLVEVLPQIAKMSSSYFAGTMNPYVPFNPILNTMNSFNPAHPMYPKNPNFENFSRFEPMTFRQNVTPNSKNLTGQSYASTPTPTHQNCDRFEGKCVSPENPELRLRSSITKTMTSSGRVFRDSTINRYSISQPPSRPRFSILLNSEGSNPRKKNGSQKKVQFSNPLIVGGTKTSSIQQNDTPKRDGKEVQRENSKRGSSSEYEVTHVAVLVGLSPKKRNTVDRGDGEMRLNGTASSVSEGGNRRTRSNVM